ncbi:Ger(x)C family spore germination protein [Lysinibacillus sp. OL1_EC]|uniref:Ger(x)C family spore germination protein n=1 Tax=unclassified Lysinibacillus TaxID=2636778 RepID=UPI00104095B6|nr:MULTISPECIES: Ger(x)C family spore germination protein [unclassified Lysinibacillus]MCM0624124.1 Ger(x)C family spore germination protein [Lysinibacillus sp. OL1_EC]MCS5501403.1 Ger(x)C family spore germination protein [Lysinibacillus sp. A4]TBV88719.1 Ger(x)C family spore germination protein [Lysinibacillus sp. OL1]WGT37227.1 Ger(x)C family spore germination protein [Lysinibacillus sp. 1 U-2021]
MSTIKHKVSFILLLSVLLLLGGCWNKRELNELAIVTAVGVDKSDEQFEISVQIVNPSQVASNKASGIQVPVFTYHAKGKSLFDAIRKLTALTPRKPYYAHAQIIIIGEEMAEEGMNSILDLFQRDPEGRSDFNFIVSHDSTAQEILSVLTPLEDVPASKMFKSLKVSEAVWGTTESVILDDLIQSLGSIDHSAVLPSIHIYGDADAGDFSSNIEKMDSPAQLKYGGLAIFKNYKLIGYLTEQESRDYNFLNNNIKSTFEIIACPEEGKISTEIINSSTKMTGHFQNDVPSISIKLDIEQNVAEISCPLDLTKSKTIDALNKETSRQIKERLERTLQTIQQTYQADLLKFSNVLHREDYQAWNRIKKNWLTLYPDLEVQIEVDVHTKGIGTATKLKLD